MAHDALKHDFNTCADCQKAAQEVEKLRQGLQAQLYGFEHPHHYLNKLGRCPVHAVQPKKPGHK
jgi:hypothetical protein